MLDYREVKNKYDIIVFGPKRNYDIMSRMRSQRPAMMLFFFSPGWPRPHDVILFFGCGEAGRHDVILFFRRAACQGHGSDPPEQPSGNPKYHEFPMFYKHIR